MANISGLHAYLLGEIAIDTKIRVVPSSALSILHRLCVESLLLYTKSVYTCSTIEQQIQAFTLEKGDFKMAAPLGTWNFFTSGAAPPGALVLAHGSTGNITGTLNGTPLTAVWDETSQILSIVVATAGGTGPNDAGFTIQAYTGTLFQPFATPNGLVSGEGVPLLLVGDFGTGKAGATVGPFNQSGWFATSTNKFKEKEGKEVKDGKDHKDKDVKDVKEKEGHPDKLPDKLPEVLSGKPGSDDVMAAAMQTDGSTLPEVRIATGQSFIPEEERPAVGSAALRN